MKRTGKTESTTDILILGAFSPEIQPVRRALRGRRAVVFGRTGIGPINATLNTSKLLLEYCPNRVIFVGSVGAASTKVKCLTVISAESVSLIDPCELLGKTETLPQGQPILRADRRWTRSALKLSPEVIAADVYTTVGLTRSRKLATIIAKDPNTQFESLELYGVAAACKAANVPWNSIQVVTNYLGPNGHKEWKRNYKRASDITAKILAQLI